MERVVAAAAVGGDEAAQIRQSSPEMCLSSALVVEESRHQQHLHFAFGCFLRHSSASNSRTPFHR